MSHNISARNVATRVVARVLANKGSLDTAWPKLQQELTQQRDQAFARELASGTLRWALRLQHIADTLSRKRPKDIVVQAVILVGLYQLSRTRVAEHAAISESVNTARALGFGAAAGMVNAVLRRYQREKQQLEAHADEDPATALAFPQWLAKLLQEDWPDQAVALMKASNERAPMWLRINQGKVDVADYKNSLSEVVELEQHRFLNNAVMLTNPVAVSSLPGFDDGLVTVQDAGAQLAAIVLDPRPGMRVLDACAAPGGKTTHILELADVALTAVELNPGRLQRLRDNLGRHGSSASVVRGDAAKPADWWDGQLYDRILLDVPCSATGVIRRHPDIKLLRRHSDLAGLVALQQEILRACWPLLAPGGKLVYSTCSLLRQENQQVVETFLRSQPQAATEDLGVEWGQSAGPGRQVLTGEAGMDGFYYSCLRHR